MKYSPRVVLRSTRSVLLTALALAVPLHAAESAPKPDAKSTPPAAAATEETLTLNPFVVSENDAVGYAATSTLAGTRINTA
ncbi:MAG: hypothetical protein RLZZ15_3619, partial [Verrucomicrobiota bacterium]